MKLALPAKVCIRERGNCNDFIGGILFLFEDRAYTYIPELDQFLSEKILETSSTHLRGKKKIEGQPFQAGQVSTYVETEKLLINLSATRDLWIESQKNWLNEECERLLKWFESEPERFFQRFEERAP